MSTINGKNLSNTIRLTFNKVAPIIKATKGGDTKMSEEKYLPHLQKKEYLESLKKHLSKLYEMAR